MTDHERVLALLDEMRETNERILADLTAILTPRPLADSLNVKPEPMATADTMSVGGWVRFPGSVRWRKIANITPCGTSASPCRRIDFDTYPGDRDGTFAHVDPATTYPFLTAEQFDLDCANEQRDAEAEDALLRAEVMADRAEERGAA